MRNPIRRTTSPLIAGVFLLGWGAFAAADQSLYENEVADEASDVSADDVDGDMFDRFIDAANEVEEIRAEYAEKVMDADEGDRADLMAEAEERMAEAVEDHDLDVSEYQEIGYLLENDDDLQERFID